MDTKPHYNILDGLRGVAALLVVWYHVHEGFAFASGGAITGINHGYLAVDFFFMLSGFVISYAYDDRWAHNLSLKSFFKRRIIRLHPMVIMGAVIGMVTFILQGSVRWDGTHVATSSVMIAMLCAMFMIPATPGCRYEVRGNGEMFPLNGPIWSLFFEYLGNILYALAIRRMSKRALTWLVVILGVLHMSFALLDMSGYGNIGVGWTLNNANFFGGMLRMLFPFTAGMLIARNFRAINVRCAFWICSAALLALFCVPYLPQSFKLSASLSITLNGAFESFCVVVVFPLLVWLGASGTTSHRFSDRICNFLGDISYTLYVIHFPFIYLFYAWLINTEKYTLAETWPVVIGLYLVCILVAYLCLKLYDIPVRKWLRHCASFLK